MALTKVKTGGLTDGSVTAAKLTDGSVTAAKITDGTITAAKLAAGVLDGGGGAISWQSSVKTSSFTGVVGEGYFVDTTSSSVTVTLPSSPSVGDLISFVDYGGNTTVNPIIFTTSDNIEGGSADKGIQYSKGAVQLVFSGTTKGWLASIASGEGSEPLRTPVTSVDVNFLVLAGGGGQNSNGYYNGGAGAGGLRTSTGSTYSGGGSSLESALTLNLLQDYTITLGAGGSARSSFFQNAGDGTDTTFASITADGGAGGYYNGSNSGGCGAGGGSNNVASRAGGAGTAGQGFAGGASSSTNNGGPGGGGGTASAGGTGSGQVGGAGGAGINNNITGTLSYYGAGGGGMRGGGSGGGYGANGTGWSATRAQTGHGGSQSTPTGGSGVIILKYPATFTATFSSGAVQNTGQISWNGALYNVSTITGGSSDTVSFAYTG